MNLYRKSGIVFWICILLSRVVVFSDDQDNARFFNAGDGLRITVPLDSTSFINGIYPIDGDGNIFFTHNRPVQCDIQES